MRYKLNFTPSAIKAFSKLHPSMREQLKKKLVERLNEPHVPKARLKYLLNTYKIKIRAQGIRLIYEINESEQTLLVLAVGKRDHAAVYRKLGLDKRR